MTALITIFKYVSKSFLCTLTLPSCCALFSCKVQLTKFLKVPAVLWTVLFLVFILAIICISYWQYAKLWSIKTWRYFTKSFCPCLVSQKLIFWCFFEQGCSSRMQRRLFFRILLELPFYIFRPSGRMHCTCVEVLACNITHINIKE